MSTTSGPTTTALAPSLILLARDVRPPHVLSHVYSYATTMNVPILILPGGRSSSELGMASGGMKCASMAMFLPASPISMSSSAASLEAGEDANANTNTTRKRARGFEEVERVTRRRANADVDSFVRYALSMIPR